MLTAAPAESVVRQALEAAVAAPDHGRMRQSGAGARDDCCAALRGSASETPGKFEFGSANRAAGRTHHADLNLHGGGV